MYIVIVIRYTDSTLLPELTLSPMKYMEQSPSRMFNRVTFKIIQVS